MTRLQAIPRVEYADLMNGLSEEQTQAIKRTGSVIVKGGVPKEVSDVSFRNDVSS